MIESKSTDKLSIMKDIVETTLEEMPNDKIQDLEELSITWAFDQDDTSDAGPLPVLNLRFAT